MRWLSEVSRIAQAVLAVVFGLIIVFGPIACMEMAGHRPIPEIQRGDCVVTEIAGERRVGLVVNAWACIGCKAAYDTVEILWADTMTQTPLSLRYLTEVPCEDSMKGEE